MGASSKLATIGCEFAWLRVVQRAATVTVTRTRKTWRVMRRVFMRCCSLHLSSRIGITSSLHGYEGTHVSADGSIGPSAMRVNAILHIASLPGAQRTSFARDTVAPEPLGGKSGQAISKALSRGQQPSRRKSSSQ